MAVIRRVRPTLHASPEVQRDRDRAITKRWLTEQVACLGRSPTHFAALAGLSPEWLVSALDADQACSPSLDIVIQITRALRVIADEKVQAAAKRLTDAASPPARLPSRVRPVQRGKATKRELGVALDRSPLPGYCLTAVDEIKNLVYRASEYSWPDFAERNAKMLLKRIGVGGSATLAELGEANGLTRERVRQLEDVLFDVLCNKLAQVETPKIDAVIVELRMAAGVDLVVFEAQFAHLIGKADLATLLVSISRLRNVDLTAELQRVQLGRGREVTVIGSEADAEFAARTADQARRLQRHAGAVSFEVLRQRLEAEMGGPIDARRVQAAIDLIGHVRWLDDARTWFWLHTEPDSMLITHAARIAYLAKSPIAHESLYGGLDRETMRVPPATIVEFGPALPPLPVTVALLGQHPWFRRSYASTIEYVGPPIRVAESSTAMRQRILDLMNRQNGVATYWEIREAGLAAGFSHYQAKQALFLNGWIERVSSGVHAIRGREIDPQVLVDAKLRAAQHLRGRLEVREDRNRVRRLRTSLRPTGPSWEVIHTMHAPLPAHGTLVLPAAEFPDGMSGNYALPDGHRIAVVDGDSGVTLFNLGHELRQALRVAGTTVTLAFDSRARTVSYTTDR